jgi:hypothetical protein
MCSQLEAVLEIYGNVLTRSGQIIGSLQLTPMDAAVCLMVVLEVRVVGPPPGG